MIVLVCGGRDYSDQQAADSALDLLHSQQPVTVVIEGGATGGDRRGRNWANARGVHCATVPALWRHYDRKAGYLRNAAMLSLRPAYCVAFPGGRGTENMVKLCREAGVTVWRPYE